MGTLRSHLDYISLQMVLLSESQDHQKAARFSSKRESRYFLENEELVGVKGLSWVTMTICQVWMKKIIEKKGVKMKLQLFVVLGILFLVSQVNAEEKLVLKNQKDKMSYIIGMEIGNNLKKQSIDIDPNIFAKGIKDALCWWETLIDRTGNSMKQRLDFQKEMMAKQEEIAKSEKKQEGRRGFPC